MNASPNAFIKEKIIVKNPTINAGPRPLESYTNGKIAALTTEPRRLKLELTPKAKASSFPLNQMETIAL